MSYSVTTLDGERKPRRLPARELDPIEIRVLGCLMEKQLATPEYYPLTLNALIAACNQKSNREPAMEVGESEVQRAGPPPAGRHGGPERPRRRGRAPPGGREAGLESPRRTRHAMGSQSRHYLAPRSSCQSGHRAALSAR